MINYLVVGDVGGTNVRLALCDTKTGKISHTYTYSSNHSNTLEDIIRHYLLEQKVLIKEACIAIASPITDDFVEMTNHSWVFSIETMKVNLGLERLEIINDFNAISMSVPMLTKKDLMQCGGGKPISGKPIAIYGAGTGLGVSHLIQVDTRCISLPGEGGHMDFAPNNKEEDNILSILRAELGHVSAERVLSGPGLVNLYRAIVKSDGRLPKNLSPKMVTEQALADSCMDSRRALALFCILMGRFGGNLALNMGTFGGVYIAGGIVPRFLDFFCASGFRAAFEDKGRLKNYLLDIPVYLIRHEQAGLLGAGAHMRQLMGYQI